MPGLKDNTQYFQDTDNKSGAFLGISDKKDISGTPYFAYKLPGANATTTDYTRVATTFDPRVAQPLTRAQLSNSRIPETASSAIKSAFGGEYSDELDHKIALQLGGANTGANLVNVPGRGSTPGFQPGVAARFDTMSNDLAQEVITGKKSLWDAQYELASAKKSFGYGNELPFVGQITGAAEQPATDLGGSIKETIPSTTKTVSDQVNNAISQGFSPRGMLRGYANNEQRQALAQGYTTKGKNPSELNTPFYKSFQPVLKKPTWLGGTYTDDNIETLSNVDVVKQNAVHAVTKTLLENNVITKPEAETMVTDWKNKDLSEIKLPNQAGNISLEDAKRNWDIWSNPIPDITLKNIIERPGATASNAWESWKEAIAQKGNEWGNIGKGYIPDPIRNVGKGFLGAATGGVLPGTQLKETDLANEAAYMLGTIPGFMVGLGKFKAAGTGILRSVGLMKNAAQLEKIAKEAGIITTTIGRAGSDLWAARMSKAGLEGAIFAAFGQAALTGRELTGQDGPAEGQTIFDKHVKQLFFDLAMGGSSGFASGMKLLPGEAIVGAGALTASLVFGDADAKTATKDAVFMMGLHALGYALGGGKANMMLPRYIERNSYIQTSNKITQLVPRAGEVFPIIREGQEVPERIPVNIGAAESWRKEMLAKQPYNEKIPRKPITNEEEALDFVRIAANDRLGEIILQNKAEGKPIETEKIKKEFEGILASTKEIYRQTTDLATREALAKEDLKSLSAQLEPNLGYDQFPRITKELKENVEGIPLKTSSDAKANVSDEVLKDALSGKQWRLELQIIQTHLTLTISLNTLSVLLLIVYISH
jgi:hypothetical protein